MTQLLYDLALAFILFALILHQGAMVKELRMQREILKQIHTMDCNSMAQWKTTPIKAITKDKR